MTPPALTWSTAFPLATMVSYEPAFRLGRLMKAGRPGIRKELRDFINDDADMWNLYLLGLWQFQEMPMKKQLSYFQVAGKPRTCGTVPSQRRD